MRTAPTEVKKALYKQKPDADLHQVHEGFKEFTCQLVIEGETKIVYFEVPNSECDFGEVVPAQLLIRWFSDIL